MKFGYSYSRRFVCIVSLAVLLGALSSRAQTIYTLAPGSNLWDSVTHSWCYTGCGLTWPSGYDADLFIGTYTVSGVQNVNRLYTKPPSTFNGGGLDVRTITLTDNYGSGSPVTTFNTPLTSSSYLTLNAAAAFWGGYALNSPGNYINGDVTLETIYLTVAGPSGVLSTAPGMDVLIDGTGYGGGWLTAHSGGQVLCGGNIDLGIEGADSRIFLDHPGTLLQASGHLWGGLTPGLSCAIYVSSGSRASIGGSISLGDVGGTTANLYVDGANSGVETPASFYAGYLGSGNAYVTDGGSITSGLRAYIAKEAGSSGLLYVSGPQSRFSSAEYLWAGAGVNSAGNLSVLDGAAAECGLTFSVADNFGSTSTLVLSGTNSTITSGTASFIGYGGVATATIDAGATLSVGTHLELGTYTGSVGNLLVGPGGTIELADQPASQIRKQNGLANVHFAGGTLRIRNEGNSVMTNYIPLWLSETSTVDTTSTSAHFLEPLMGTGGLAKAGSGTLTLEGTNSYQGGTTVSEGLLVLRNPGLSDKDRVYLSTNALLNLDYSGTDSVDLLFIEGVAQAAGTWGSPTSSADHTTTLISGAGLLMVTNPLASSSRLLDLVPSAGSLSPAFDPDTLAYTDTFASSVTNIFFTPTAEGGSYAYITINGLAATSGLPSAPFFVPSGTTMVPVVVTSMDGASTSHYLVAVVRSPGLIITGGGLALLEQGGSFMDNNLATSGVAFAKDVLAHPSHTIPHLNDGLYGNSNRWIPNSANSFAGINLGAAPVSINQFAFGRDNEGLYNDSRIYTTFTLQYTTYPNPDESINATNWITIGSLEYIGPEDGNFSIPMLRHRYSFDPVDATGIRIQTVSSLACIDEIELYGQASPIFSWRQQWFGIGDNSGPGANGADPNSNGIPNLLEYALGGDPTGTTTGVDILPQPSIVSNRFRVEFNRYPDRSDVAILLDALTHLREGTWSSVVQSVDGDPFLPLDPQANTWETGTGAVRAVVVEDPFQANDPTNIQRNIRIRATAN